MWDRQIPELIRHWRVLRFDLPGHGGAPARPAATAGDLADRLLATLDGLGVERFAYAGACVSGAIGVDLALRHPHRLASLALIGSAAHAADTTWVPRAADVRANGLEPVARSAPERWFTPLFGGAQPAIVDWAVQMVRTTDLPCYAAACEALAAFDARAGLGRIAVPTLVIVGADDQVTSPADARELVAGIPDARLAMVPAARHLAPVEQPVAVTDLLVRHFNAPWATPPGTPSAPGVSAGSPAPGVPSPGVPASATAMPGVPVPGAPSAPVGPSVFAPVSAEPGGSVPGAPASATAMPGDSPAASAVPGFPAAATATPGTPAPGAAPVPFAAAGAPVSSVGTAPDPATAAAPVGEGTEPHPGFGPPVGGNPYAGTASGSPVFGGTTTPGVPGALPPDHADHAGGTDTTDPAGRPDHTGRTGPTDALAAGARLRREVLGDAAPAASGGHRAFTADFEDFATRVAWGDTWARPGLDRRARFLVALTALTVGGHLDELAEHTRAALRGGVTPGEIKETLLQCSLHCGLPAARAAFAVAGRVVAEERDARDGHDPQT